MKSKLAIGISMVLVLAFAFYGGTAGAASTVAADNLMFAANVDNSIDGEGMLVLVGDRDDDHDDDDDDKKFDDFDKLDDLDIDEGGLLPLLLLGLI